MNTFNEEYRYISELGIELQEQYKKTRDLNEVSENELEIIKFGDDSILTNINQISKLENKALYALYMKIPRRLEVRFIKIRLNNDTKNTNIGNYIILDTNKVPTKLIFNDYKTAKFFGQQIIEVPEVIKNTLHEYILDEVLIFFFFTWSDKKRNC